MKLGFICKWDAIRENTWSGTPYGLYKELEKKYDLFDIDTGNRSKDIRTIICRVKYKLDHLLGRADMGLFRIKMTAPKIRKMLQGHDFPVLTFGEILEDYPGKQYIYQDLYAGYVKKMADTNPDIFAVSGFQNCSKRSIYKCTEIQDAFYERVDKIFVMGKWLEKSLIEEYHMPSSKVVHVGGGINLDGSLVDYSQKNGHRILFVGCDFDRKNGQLVVDSFKILKSKDKDAELYIAGPTNLNIQMDGVHILGNLPSNKLYQYFNLCDVFCMPSKFEAYGLVFIEALVYGLPCIGRNAYEMPYFIDDNETGYLLRNETPEALSELMMKALRNEKMKENVRRRREYYLYEYSWENVARRISEVIGQKE